MTLRLTNPHSVLAALETRPRDVEEVLLPPRGAGDAWNRVAEEARAAGVSVVTVEGGQDAGGPLPAGGSRAEGAGGREPRGEARGRRRGPAGPRGPHGGRPWERGGRGGRRGRPGDDERGPKEGRSGGACALVRPREPLELEDLLARAAGPPADGAGPGLWLALDQVQDPRNVGATFRAAAFFGVRGAVLTRDRSAPLTAVSYDAASGGLEHVPFASPPNLARALRQAKDAGLWILGAAEDGEVDVAEVDRGRPWLLVVGNEESGLRRLTREGCDQLCRLTPRGAVASLNVSVAAAVLMAELTRPR